MFGNNPTGFAASLLTLSFVATVYVYLLGPQVAKALVLAPFDADPECRNRTAPAESRSSTDSGVVVLIDSHSYLSLDRLWFADDESIDLFSFPIPTDAEVWELVDDSDCRNVWRYCGGSTSDILLTQFITSGEVPGTELLVRIEFNYFSESASSVPLTSCLGVGSGDSENALIVEADDTFTVFSQKIPCSAGRLMMNDSTGIRQSYYEFTFTPMDSFELVVRANLSDDSCVNVSRIRVFHHICPNVTINYVHYQQTVGGMYSGTCVLNALPVNSSNNDIIALCTPQGEWMFPPYLTKIEHCHCAPGYYPDSIGIECIPCRNGTYKSTFGNDRCIPCPMNSHTPTTGSSFCQCNAAYVRANRQNVTLDCEACARNYFSLDGVCTQCPIPGLENDHGALLETCMCLNGSINLNYTEEYNSTSNVTCEYCARDYYRSSNNVSCLLCPLNSYREPNLYFEYICNCTPGSLTADGQRQTVMEPCDKCDESHFISGSRCLPCPAYSSSTSLEDTECTCEANTSTPYGNTTTTIDACICVNGLFRSPNGDCIACPANSNRRTNTHDNYCYCDTGYARRPEDSMGGPCYGPVIGFIQQSLRVLEGSSSHVVAVRIHSSFPIAETFSIDLNVTGVSTLQDSVSFARGADFTDYSIVIDGDEVALETDKVIRIKLIQSGSNYLIGSGVLTGNQSYHCTLNIDIREDDTVHVGFTQSSVTASVSQGYLELIVGISTNIGQDLAIQVTSNFSLSVFTIQRTVFTFIPNGSLYVIVPIQLLDKTDFLVDAYYVGINIELVEEEYLRNEVRIGGTSGLSEQLTMVLLPPQIAASLSHGAEIGIISCCAAFMVVVLVLVSVLAYCYCRRRIGSHRKHYHKSDSCSDGNQNKKVMMELEPRSSKSHEMIR